MSESEAIAELRRIMNARRFDKKYFDDDTAFADWVQSRARHTLLFIADAAPPAVPDAPPKMSDEVIITIRDSLLPSQGEPFDCIAFARAILEATRYGDDGVQWPYGAVPDAPPMQGDDAELCEKLMEQPTEDLQGFAAVECGQLMGLAAERIEQLSTQDHNWHTWGIIEVAIRNPNVSSYMDHLEKRTLAAESLVDQQKERIAELVETLMFYADSDTWFAVGLFPDPPCGAIMDDFDEADDGIYRPGKRARAAIAALAADREGETKP